MSVTSACRRFLPETGRILRKTVSSLVSFTGSVAGRQTFDVSLTAVMAPSPVATTSLSSTASSCPYVYGATDVIADLVSAEIIW